MARWTDNPGGTEPCGLCGAYVLYPDRRVAFVANKMVCGDCVEAILDQTKLTVVKSLGIVNFSEIEKKVVANYIAKMEEQRGQD